MEYTISKNKLDKIVELVNNNLDMSFNEIEEFVLADWPEGQEHQDWLNTESANTIADWVVACNKN